MKKTIILMLAVITSAQGLTGQVPRPAAPVVSQHETQTFGSRLAFVDSTPVVQTSIPTAVYRPDVILFNGVDGNGNNYALGGAGISLNGISWDDANLRYVPSWKVGVYLFGKIATTSNTPKSLHDVGAIGLAGGYKIYTGGLVYAPSSKTLIYSIGISTTLFPYN